MDYNFNEIESKWHRYWRDNHTYRCSNESDKPHYYVLDMFPYPSGAGHEGSAGVPEGTVRLQPNPAHGKVEVVADVELQG